MVNSRNKGAAFERVIVRLINEFCEKRGLDETVKRNLDQYQSKGMADIYWRNFAIECKCYAGKGTTFAQEKWWAQACESAAEKLIPVLIYKYNRNKPRYVLPAALIFNGVPLNNQSVMVGYVDDLCNDIDVILENAHYI
tara:strand:+ start:258 stop:674 length:417 start_codon:yes stop_codon:yes gene_type:complete